MLLQIFAFTAQIELKAFNTYRINTATGDDQQTAEAAARWNTTALHSLEDVAALRPDVVHVCSPNALHADHVCAAIAAGAHVICEKPLATSKEDAEALVALAQVEGKVTAVPFVYRFHPLIREIRARRVGGFGVWRLLHGSYLQDWLLSPNITS